MALQNGSGYWGQYNAQRAFNYLDWNGDGMLSRGELNYGLGYNPYHYNNYYNNNYYYNPYNYGHSHYPFHHHHNYYY